MKWLLFTVSLIPLVACSHHTMNRQVSSLGRSILTGEVEEPASFKGWRKNASEQHGDLDFTELRPAEIHCSSTQLTPSSPDMSAKEYFNAMYGVYDHRKLNPESGLCLIRSKSKKPFCLKADGLYYVVVSDLYQDKCGNYYRGYTEVMFQKSYETMGTLFSPGRTMYQNPKSEFQGDMIVGHTYPVEAGDFYFLRAASPEEIAKIRDAKAFAQKRGHIFDPEKNAYLQK